MQLIDLAKMAESTNLEVVLRGVPAEKLNLECSSDDLNEISQSLTRWPEVSPWLGLTEADEEEMRAGGDRGPSGLKRERIDVLRRWKGNHKDKATYRSLIDAFYRAQRLDLVDVVIELLQTPTASKATPFLSHGKPSQALPLPTPQTSSQSVLAWYRSDLKETYKYLKNVPVWSVQWPPTPIQKAFNLAMIKKMQVQRGEISDDFVRLTVTGKVDDILHMKSPVKLEDIFQIDQEDRKVILIEGAPGSGKSTLSWDICKRWGAGELFQEYKVVILVQLRDPEVQAATSLADLVPAQDRTVAQSVASQVLACKGDKVLFVLDGWDELPRSLQKSSLFRNLIDPKLLDHTLLKSAVIVTSRPISSGELHPLVSSRVEIIGFTPDELRQYFSECLSGDSQAVEVLLERVGENPVVASSCYLPLNAAIIVHLFLSGNQTLSTTVHGIFTSLVLCCLSRYQRERLGLEGEAANVDSLNNLTMIVQEPFRQLCKLAFLGVMEDAVTFSSTDLETFGICTDVSALGLLQAVPSIVSHEMSASYNFLHLQIQELLAAYHISFLPGSEQISHFLNHFDHPRFAAVFQFYAGITRFQSKRKYLSKLAFLLPKSRIPTGVCDVITNMIRGGDRQLLVSVIRCLFEADDPSLCQFVARQLKGELSLNDTTLSPLDCLSVGYFLSCVCATTTREFKAYLHGCSIDDHSCKFLMRGLSRCPIPNSTATGQLNVNLAANGIREEGAQCIAQVLRNSSTVQRLNLYGNSVGEAGLKSIAETLLTNSSLVALHLSSCSLKITMDNGPVLRQVLQRSSTLEVLDLSFNDQISDMGAIYVAQGLKRNTSLRELNLNCCGIGDEGVSSLSWALGVNDSLEALWLWGNNSISKDKLSVLVALLSTNRRLVSLCLPRHLSRLGVEEAINSVRRREQIPLITVYYFVFSY